MSATRETRHPHKKRFRSDGSSIWTKRSIDGPGVWITCVKGKEKQSIGEVYDLFEMLSEKLWPTEASKDDTEEQTTAEDQAEDDLEKAIANEVSKLKRPRKEQRFANCPTDTPCMIFISCKPPVDTVLLIETHLKEVEKTGITHTRNVLRLAPVSASCDANIAEIKFLVKRIVTPKFEVQDEVYRYKIELRIRNHNTVLRDEVIKAIAECIPLQHKVDLANAELFILIEIFKSTCGIALVRDYYRYKKFNVVEMAQARAAEGERQDAEEAI